MNPRLRRAAPSLVAILLAGPLLSACSGSAGADADRQSLLAAFRNTLDKPYTFTDSDTDLEHTALVTGTIADAYRHSVLLTEDGKPQWEEIVKDDAVADYFPNAAAVAKYSGNGTSDYADASGAHPLVAPQTVTPAAPPGATPAASPSPGSVTTVTAGSEVPDESSAPAVLTALTSGQWVIDPDGAPAPASGANSTLGREENPFYEALLSLSNAYAIVQGVAKGGVKHYEKDNLFPAFKPVDDPFPAPTKGVIRYDVLENPVPGVALGKTEPDPLGIQFVSKLAVYVSHGQVIQVREVDDPTDRLQTISQIYKINLPAHLSTLQEEEAGERIVNAVQSTQSPPYRVHSETLTLSFIGTPSPINLPTSYVRGPLNLLPLHGAKTPAVQPSS